MAGKNGKKPTRIKSDPRNARKHGQRNKSLIRESLETVGPLRSIGVDGDNIIRAGNGVFEQAEALGLKVRVVDAAPNELIAVRRPDLKGRRAIQAALYDNRTGEVESTWDTDVLAEIAERDGDLLRRMFEGDKDMLAAIGPQEQADAEPQIDRAEELNKKWQVKAGDLWRIGEHRLLCGDSTRREDVERVMQGEKAQLVVTDPPYGVSYADKNKFLNAISRANRVETPIENDHGTKEETQAMWKAAFAEMSDVMSPGAVVYCFMPQGGDQMMMMMMMMMGAGIEPRHELIWIKNNHVLGRVDYAYKHEPILYAWKDGEHKFYGDFQTSILEFPKPMVSDLHPTMKPTPLIERLISNSSIRDSVVFDPFVGSGTTIVACQNLHRKCRAIEISPAYCAVTLERMATAFPGIEIERLNGSTQAPKAHRKRTTKAT